MNGEVEERIADLRSPHAETRESAARRLGQIGNPAAIEGLIGALSDQATEVCVAAIEALAKLGSSAVPALLETLYHHDDSSVRYAVTMVLGGIHDAEATAGLMTALQDSHPDVQSGAVLALESIGTSEALAAAMAWRHEHSDLSI